VDCRLLKIWTFAATEKGEPMRMNRGEHDVFLEIAPRLCQDCEDDCPGELSCAKLAKHIVEEKEAARDEQ
jgi:hypothetical protein